MASCHSNKCQTHYDTPSKVRVAEPIDGITSLNLKKNAISIGRLTNKFGHIKSFFLLLMIFAMTFYFIISDWKSRYEFYQRNKPLKGGCHDFQYLDHKFSWHWDWWKNVKKKLLEKLPENFIKFFSGLKFYSI